MDCGFIPKSSRVSLGRFTPKGYLLFLCVDLKIDGSQHSKGVRGGGPAATKASGAAAPLTAAGSSPASTDFAIPCTKS